MAETTRLPGKAESMKYDGTLPENVEIFDPGSMASLFKPQFVFVYEEPKTQQKVAFVYREYAPGDDLLIFDKPLLERDQVMSKKIREKGKDEVFKKADLSIPEIIEMFEFNRHDAQVRDKTLQVCCVNPILTEEILNSLSEDCKNQFYVEVMKGVRANKELVSEFQEEDSEPEA